MLGHADPPVGPRVTGPLPGPGAAGLLIRQSRRESNARVYPRHIAIEIDEAWGSFVRDLDGNVFIDFLPGAGVRSLGHSRPERVVTEQLSRPGHGLGLPTPATRSMKGEVWPGIPWRRNLPHRCASPRPASTRRRAEALHHGPVTLLLTRGPR
ncbi:hypothetical protein GCM10023320_24550 [Pseudonocardia adelaidensis]|uniref:Aminotransferase class III n=1 Tax=Pseudonocardia adelaidensis TaxID=648754 RepID=A0ABP9NN76_9PSEU